MKASIVIVLFTTILITNSLGAALYISDKSEITRPVKKQQFKSAKKNLNNFYTDKKLGSYVENGKTVFRIFSPSSQNIKLVTFNLPEETKGKEYVMRRDSSGVWEAAIDGENYGLYYAFKVKHKNFNGASNGVLSLDPYAKAVASYNTYMGQRKAIVVKEGDYDWGGDTWIQRDWRDLIIYEMHVRDMTAHPSSGSSNPGTYKGLIEKGKPGGIDYIKSLGVNTVELLPTQEFANIEIPFNKQFNGRKNTWNPYERNHWGYMTAAFFAPEAYYSEDWGEMKWNVWEGRSGNQVNQFKDMVKAFHKEGIAVMMDVVYNHLSEYEIGNLKEIDKEYYFRLDSTGNYVAESYCGNDLKTERPMMRRLIIESVLYWMKEYHIDGFRFDLGRLIDWETIEEVIHEAQKINPNVIFVCEPWGGGYDPMGFSLRGWGSWNDQIRNGIKGENPLNGLGWIFGNWYGNNNYDRIKSYVNGTLVRDAHGLFQRKEHSVNYLESHDGYTLSDFIRIGSREVNSNQIIKDVGKHVKLTPLQLKLNKLAAMFLFTSQGITMIHSGQEFARSKVIPFDINVKDEHKGKIDHNSYNKDNETNYINFTHAKINGALMKYYQGLIALRKKFTAFRRADYESIKFFKESSNEFALAYKIYFDGDEFIVMMNAHPENSASFDLGPGYWNVLADENDAGTVVLRTVSGIQSLAPSAGMILKKAD